MALNGSEREKGLEFQDYLTKDYFSYNQLCSFIEQIYHIKSLEPTKMIEIGLGNGFVSTFLKRVGIEITTIDINSNLNPDLVLSVEKVGNYFKNKEHFDLISCCEVLEHIPFDHFENIIRDFSEISDQLFLTLPLYNRLYGFGGFLQFPKFSKWVGFWIKIYKTKKLTSQHFWELNYSKETKLKNIIAIIKKYYPKTKSDLVKGKPEHCYFICRK